jgi:hypothetical protein
MFCLNQFGLAICEIMVSYTCSYQVDQPMFQGAKISGNVLTATLPLFILVIVLSNETNRKVTVLEIFRQAVSKYRLWRRRNQASQRATDERVSFVQELDSFRNSAAIEMVELHEIDSFLDQLNNKNRGCLLATLLGCLSIHHLELRNLLDRGLLVRTSAVEEDSSPLFLWNYSEKSYFVLSESLQECYSHIFIEQLVTLRMELITYAPTILNEFVLMDGVSGLGEGLAPLYNYQEIINDCMNNEGGGGRSGQFFFFNRDRTLILKTVSST